MRRRCNYPRQRHIHVLLKFLVSFHRANVALLNGNYGPLLAGHPGTGAVANTAAQFCERVSDTSAASVIGDVTGSERLVKTLHRPQLYRSVPGTDAPWVGLVYVFRTDQSGLAVVVYLGHQHPVCTYYRHWIREDWLCLESDVRQFKVHFYRGRHSLREVCPRYT
jgi:hypothetical protein